MIRGLLNLRNKYSSNAVGDLASINSINETAREKLTTQQEIFGILNSIMSLATMKAMKNESISKNIRGNVPKGYRIEPTSLFQKIFGDPYRFYKDDNEISYQDYMTAKYINDYKEQ